MDNKSQGGAISVARQDAYGLTINAAKGSEVLFDGNQVILESGTRAYGGAIYSRGGIGSTDLTNITFTDNSITMNTIGGTKGQGGAVFVHKGGDLNVSDSTFTGNYIKNTVSEGTANGDIVYGGALASSEGGMNLTGTNTFEGNYVSSILGNAYGGAMAVEPGADHAITISGNNTFDSNTASGAEAYGGAIFGKDVTFSGEGSEATFTGNKANDVNNDIHVAENGSVTITHAGTYSFGGGITTDAGGTLTISDGANVTFENGSITDIQGAMTLAGANLTLNIDDATKFTVGSITASGNHQLMVNYDGTNDLVLTTGTVTGLTNAKVNFTNKTFADGELGYLDASNGLVIKTVNMEDGTAGIFNRISSGILTTSETLNGLGTAVDGDQIIVTKNTTLAAGDSIKVPANLTISSNNSTTNRTINANGASGIFTTAGTSALTLENITISGAYREGLCVYGSVISGGSWNIIGGEFTNNKTYGKILPTQDSDHVAKGGAIYGDDLNLQDVTFTGNIVEANDETFRTDPEKNTMSVAQGGAVHGNGTVNISGNSDFTGNQAISGDVTDTGRNRKDPAIGGAISGQTVNIGNDGEDKITFSGNIASSGSDKGNTTDLGGSIGGAIGSDSGAVNVTAQNGDSIIFEGNKAVTKNSRALGGAIGAGRNGYNSTVAVKAEDGGEILFQNNEAASENGTLPVMGGAIYTDGTVIAENAEFNSNHVKFNVSNETKDAADGNYDDQTVASAAGGAIAVHSNYNNTAVQVKDSVFTGNTVEVTGNADGAEVNAYGGAVAAFAKDGKGTSTIEVSGKNVFENNSVSNSYGDAKGGAIYGDTVTFDGGESTFIGNTANGVQNDVHAETAVAINGGTHHFGGGITTGENGKLDITKAAVSFGDNAIVSVHGGSITGSTLDLGKGVKIDGLGSVTVDSLTFKADPTANGFSSISATENFTVNTVDVGLNVFTVGAMDNTTNTLTLIDGGKAAKFEIEETPLMTDASTEEQTALKINQDKNGQYGSASLKNSELVGIDFGGKDSLEVKDFSLLVDGEDIDLNAFAEWIEGKTGLETGVGSGMVSVRLETPFEIMASDSFIWDFSGYDKAASLQFVTANIMDNAVPEPTTWALLVLGGLGIFGIARKNRKAKK
ncbi:MAG: PEP-CTERM sorting domain-containing protein [Thermoguttaceae bacterium]|nr:PEP-CTERM sorting domain-containing protein [Thermoguttaceae bacterium]